MKVIYMSAVQVPSSLPSITHLMQPFMSMTWIYGFRILAFACLAVPLLVLTIQLQKERSEANEKAKEAVKEPTLDELLERSRALRSGFGGEAVEQTK